MAFLVTSLIFAVVGIIASICTRICFNQGPSTKLFLELGRVEEKQVGGERFDIFSGCPSTIVLNF